MAVSTAQAEILQHACLNGNYRSELPQQQDKARKLNAKGLLSRDPKDGSLWYPTDKALQLAAAASVVVLAGSKADEAANMTVERSDASDLAATVERARALLDEGDVLAAKILASGAYREAKAAAGFAAEFGAAGRRLVAKARTLQADALLIETRAKIRIAKAYDEAKAEGRAAGQGRPKNIPDVNVFTQEEAGLSAKEIHDARRLAEAEEKAPGIVERAIAARLEAGLEPSRANLRASIGTKTATNEERGNNLYETPPEAVRTLLAIEEFGSTIWEPACGRGAISSMLEAAGHRVMISDLEDYGTADQFGELQQVKDFLETEAGAMSGAGDIVTNPPYGTLLNRFVAHALKTHKPRKMALLLNVNFFGGSENEDRNFALDKCKPARIHWFSRRLPMMHRDGWDGPEASSSMNTAWFVWERQSDGGYSADTIIRRVDWKQYQPAALAEAAE